MKEIDRIKRLFEEQTGERASRVFQLGFRIFMVETESGDKYKITI